MNEAFVPRIAGFLCNWCSYAGADKAGLARLEVPKAFRAVRVMCSGRIEPAMVAEAFEAGADGVLILACHPGDCHYKEGNLRAASRVELLRSLMSQMGIDAERLAIEYVSASQSKRFIEVVEGFTAKIAGLGPLKSDNIL